MLQTTVSPGTYSSLLKITGLIVTEYTGYVILSGVQSLTFLPFTDANLCTASNKANDSSFVLEFGETYLYFSPS
ncbi:MAG: hypothetical protein K6E72_07565 [Saccharofermentans sp.]|nr:hypothetical protein [Saccharofermentans sp.]